jgi:photosystem II stability/assembly factor-like uncharacterized protein
MKRLIYCAGFMFCLFALFFVSSCKKQKCYVPPSPEAKSTGFTWTNQTTTGNWMASSYPDVNHGFVVGMGGSMVKTSNGSTYSVVATGTTEDLYATYFFNGTDGFIAGNNGVFKQTNNGGASWTNVTLPSGVASSVSYRNIYFYNSTLGFVTGGNNTILKTTNGGGTWSLINNGIIGGSSVYGIYFTDENIGYAGGDYGYIYNTIDGGANWSGQIVFSSRAVANDITFIDNNTGYASIAVGFPVAGDTTTLMKTTDGGQTWQVDPHSPHSTSGNPSQLSHIKFFNNQVGYMTGGYTPANTGELYCTTNGGQSWSTVSIPSCGRLRGLSLLPSEGKLYAVGLTNTILQGN